MRRFAICVAHLASVLNMTGWAVKLGCWKKLEDTGQRLCDTQKQLSTRLSRGLLWLARTLAAPHVDIYLGT